MKVKVARIGKPHGIRGEVTVQLFTDEPQLRFAPGARLSVETASEAARAVLPSGELEVRSARWNKQILVVGFAQVTDRNTAEALRDSQLFVEGSSDTDDDADDAWYEHELLQMDVLVADPDRRVIGTVTGLRTMPHQDLLQVKLAADGREIDIPFVQEIVADIDQDQGTVLLTPPPGLLELGSEQEPTDAP
ncbi:ribosome maturation factor RimM [Kocuria sp.]|uniref:ribosome maturation factor RimM n=1 Tax=Kocuria sp. TaxID=1871328 RepID=UPI0026E0B8D8|nr:ribosome maturation factor RimM [Kocuria sp.]MDO5618293.1 ribosome maturation factor RimM [Kocuria sp.]